MDGVEALEALLVERLEIIDEGLATRKAGVEDEIGFESGSKMGAMNLSANNSIDTVLKGGFSVH